MVLIIGGLCQGKTSFAREHFHLLDSEIISGKDLELTMDLKTIKCVDDFELFLKKSISQGKDPLLETQNLIAQKNDLIIILPEIGCGIVPMEKEEREFREITGRVGEFLSKKSEKVIRLFCGLPKRLK